MRIPAGLTSTGMTTSTAASPTPEARDTRARTGRSTGGPATVLMRPTRSTTVGGLIIAGVMAGLIAAAAVVAVILSTHPEPPTLLSGFGPESTWAMPATAVAAALGLTFLIAAFIVDRRTEEALRRACREREPGTPEAPDEARPML